MSKNIISSLFKGVKNLKERAHYTMLSTTTILSDVAIWGALSVLTISISIEIFDKGSWGYGVLDGMYGIGAFFILIIVGYLTKNNSRIYCLQKFSGLLFIRLYITLFFIYNAKYLSGFNLLFYLSINIVISRVYKNDS